MRLALVCLLSLLAGCRGCNKGTGGVVVEPVRVAGSPLRFEDTYVGAERQLSFEVSNPARVSQTLQLRVDAPFTLETESLVLGGGAAASVTVIFRPAVAGEVAATVQVGDGSVEVSGRGLETPACVTAAPCESASFDTELAQCIAVKQVDGTACSQQCVMNGQCQAGRCVGLTMTCSDGDACTIDSCRADGCLHTPLSCPPPANPCKMAACDSSSGCGELDAEDGTVCGPDACTDSQVSVCVTGQCVSRPRPVTERCTNTWVPLRLPSMYDTAIAFDPVSRKLITLAGRQTWLWNGTDWTQRFPPAAPPGGLVALSTDTRRNRVVAFVAGETWEWDGVTWLFQAPVANGPGARYVTSLAYDPVRRVTVLFGGRVSGMVAPGDTWEWNGLKWTQRTTAHAPSARFGAAMAWDPSRGKVLLFGGTFDHFVGASDTWELDGVDWVERTFTSAPPPRYQTSLAWNPLRNVFTVVAGIAYDPLDDIWELGAEGWSLKGHTPHRMYSLGAAWDPMSARLVVLDRGVTYAFDGQALVPTGHTAPIERGYAAVAFDALRGRTTLFGGYPSFSPPPLYPSANDTWVRDATSWSELNLAVKPAPRYGSALVWDRVRQRLVLFGGSSQINSMSGVVGQRFDDTWSFDGSTWTQLSPPTAPPAGVSLGTWDDATQRVIVVAVEGGATWAFDGLTWSKLGFGLEWGAAVAFDPLSQRLMAVFNNQTWVFSGARWVPIAPATPLPSNYYGGQLAWDPSRQRVVVVGEHGTFAWNGSDWSNLKPTAQPFPAVFDAMIFDSAQNRLVAFTRGAEWTLLP